MAQMKDMTPIAEGDVVLAKKEAAAARGILTSAQAFQARGVGSGGDGERVSLTTEERMQKKRERYEAAKPVAVQILEEARNALAVRFRFLDQALWRMPLIPSFDVYGIASDGRALYFDPVYVVDRFKISFNEVVRDVIHCLFHCIFRHPFMLYSVLRQPWDVACDIAIEAIILDLVSEEFPSNMDRRAKEALHVLKAHVDGVVTAERLYWFFGNEGNHTDLKSLAPMFFHDSHGLWYGDDEEDMRKDAEGAAQSASTPDQSPQSTSQSLESEDLDAIADEPVPVPLPEDAPTGEDGAEAEGAAPEPLSEEEREQLAEEWADIARRMEVDLETHLARAGEGAGNLVVALKALDRDVGHYAEFLSRFATLHETMRVNDEEFDYIYYKYGLDHYGNLPLIEPLEYKDDKRIHDFVIAIDTSESCSGEVVQAFMNKTYSILKDSESFTERVNIHLIQCDAEVQEDVRITSLEQLEQHMQNMELKGFGGTDFRPVFSYVDLLIEKGDITDLRGLLYFTDGEGVYPKRPPAYDAAFVFLDDGYTSPAVPPWALKTIVTKEELEVRADKNEGGSCPYKGGSASDS